ncbi:MAG: acyl-CoA thioesterase [Chloroflexota bacterium]|nr:MAG: acyl-CoA thioesterase [Chloroflexota bacterium]
MNEPAEWPFEIAIRVIFRDLDAMGHVNNAVYFTYMETARTTFFVDGLRLAAPGDLPVTVAEATCTYHSALTMGEQVLVQMGVGRIGQRSFDLEYRMKAGNGRLVASAKTTMVTYDYSSGRAILVPANLHDLLNVSLAPSPLASPK